MKISEFRSLIKEEVRKVLKESKTRRSLKEGRDDAALLKDIYKFFGDEDSVFAAAVEAGVEKLPSSKQEKWDDTLFRRSYGEEIPVDFQDELQFYVDNARYFDPKLVAKAKELVSRMD
jgi:hypothetical protein